MYFEELSVGMEKTLPDVTIEKERMLAFAREYDNIPLHTDEEYAKTTRYGGLIAPGVMSFMTVWNKFVEDDFFGDSLVAGKSTKIEWFAPVYAGDILSGRIRISRLEPHSKHNGMAVTEMDIVNQDGKTVMSNTTEVIVSRKNPTVKREEEKR